MIHSISALMKEIGKELTCIGEKINRDCTLKMGRKRGARATVIKKPLPARRPIQLIQTNFNGECK